MPKISEDEKRLRALIESVMPEARELQRENAELRRQVAAERVRVASLIDFAAACWNGIEDGNLAAMDRARDRVHEYTVEVIVKRADEISRNA